LKGKCEKLSKEGATSDRFEGKMRKAVKRRSNFRQVWSKSTKSCQKKEQLQTGLKGKCEKLSKEGATSDRFEGKMRKAVRRRSNFRQV
jgi:hypothetical protein